MNSSTSAVNTTISPMYKFLIALSLKAISAATEAHSACKRSLPVQHRNECRVQMLLNTVPSAAQSPTCSTGILSGWSQAEVKIRALVPVYNNFAKLALVWSLGRSR